MKPHLPLSLLSALLTALWFPNTAAAESTTSLASTLGQNWNNTAYIGDSITHGYSSGSRTFRWHLFKTLVDNGITQNEVGIQSGFRTESPTLQYGGVAFENLHAAQSGIKGAQIAGTTTDGNTYLGGSNLEDWLGLDSSYSGTYTMHDASGTTATPDTAYVMFGTNDVNHCTGGKGMTADNVDDLAAQVQSYLDSVITSLQKANPNVTIVVSTLPAWTQKLTDRNGKNADASLHAVFNAAMADWAQEKGVTLLDINRGMIDLAETANPGVAVSSMYLSDGVHPGSQGDLLIASNMAQQLGYAGRTAGQQRVAASSFHYQAGSLLEAADTAEGITLATGEQGALALDEGASLSFSWADTDELSKGFTVDVNFSNGFGDGAENGWDTSSNFSLNLGDGTHAGTLNVNEAYIQWGNTILYSTDSSQLTDDLRVAYVYGNSESGLSSGFYVWLGDMLIGEALSGTGSTNGLNLSNGTGTALTLGHLSLATGAWAPTSTGISYGNPLIEATQTSSTTSVTLTSQQYWNGPNANVCAVSKATGGDVDITVAGTSSLGTEWLVINNGEKSTYEGNLRVTLTGTMTHNSAGNKYNVLHYLGELKGSVSLTVAEGFTETNGKGWGGFQGTHGTSGAYATVGGDVNMVFSSADLSVTPHANAWLKCAVAGVGQYANVGGGINITIDAGTFSGDVYGGIYQGGGSIGRGTQVTLNGGSISGNVYGGGTTGTISGGTAVTVTGAAHVTGSLISAGGTGGKITDGSCLTVKDVDESSAFAAYSGVLSGGGNEVEGGRALVLDGVKLAALKAGLQGFDSVTITGKSDVGLSSLGGATQLNVDADNRLVLTGGTHDAVTANAGTIVLQEGASLRLNAQNADGNSFGTYELTGGSLTVGAYGALESRFEISSGTFIKESAATTLSGGLHLAADGHISLAGVAAADIAHLETAAAGAQISGLSGTLQLEEAIATLGTDNLSEAGASFLFDEGGLSVQTLTLNLSAELTAALLKQANGGAGSYALTSALPALVISNSALSAERVVINLAEGYEGYRATAIGIEMQDGYSYVSYSVAKAVPEPSTACLSLLALSALAMRRRRR